MKYFIFLLFTLLVYIPVKAQDTEVIRLSEPVSVTETHEVFGSDFVVPETLLTLTDLIAAEGDYLGKEVVIQTTVAKVCQKKGCFFVAQNEENTARITFKDYSFFIPTDSKGKKVTLVGTFDKKVLTEDKAKHYAEDAGEDTEKIKGEQVEYSIVATSVSIPKSK